MTVLMLLVAYLANTEFFSNLLNNIFLSFQPEVQNSSNNLDMVRNLPIMIILEEMNLTFIYFILFYFIIIYFYFFIFFK